ncbi:outer membrane beta-barrel protein [Sphingomonas aracearum]|uniref:Outer membrane beta-barrel protein n=1 Tax=Sphingomonas aracearum TaxID=2283317 RepID=A0A369VYU8_9SPHN|nr:outer membrane beta-barrel protein [Sphingomonas aracearum]RDE06300.1 hypothetical protein DVW87_00780 [Sphingomonas aracearum]
MKGRSKARACLTLGMVCSAWGATAQEIPLPPPAPAEPLTISDAEQAISLDVAARRRPEFDAIGVPVGAATVFPSLAVGTGFSSNLFGSETGRRSDGFVQVEPALSAQVTSARYRVRAEASARFQRFWSEPAANETAWRVGGSGGAQFGRLLAELEADVGQQIERRDSSGYPDGLVEPVRYLQLRILGRGQYDVGRLRAIAIADYTKFDFKDTRALSPSGQILSVVNQRARDQRVLRGTLRGEYRVAPALSLFAQGTASSIDYRLDFIAPGVPNLDGSGYTALVGAAVQVRLLQLSAGVGYTWRDYSNAALRRLKGTAVSAEGRYFLTPLVTLSATANRTISEAALQGASGYLNTQVTARADYELRRWAILNTRIAHRSGEFRGTARRDRVLEAGGGAEFRVNRRFSLGGDFNYLDRTVRNDPLSPSFNEWRGLLTLRASL